MRLETLSTALLVASTTALSCDCPEGSLSGSNMTNAPYGNGSSTIGGNSTWNWGMDQKGTVKGVNIGGWLLLEPWITPSLFSSNEEIVDEYTLSEKDPNAQSILQKHWEGFITEQDFQEIKEVGFNMVRIAIGYWAFRKLDYDPYIPGAASYLDKAITWASKAGLHVLIDLHGAPGSQNGFDNSGQATQNATWTQKANILHTLDVLQILANKYGNNPTVAAIGLLNEPFPEKLGYKEAATAKIVSFHNCAAKTVRGASSPSTAVTISDAFTNAFHWNDEYEETGPGKNVIDHHDYQVFDPNLLALNLTAHLDQITLNIEASVANSTHPTIIGEWSGALTDCALYLNGRNEGARFENKFTAGPSINNTCATAENSKEEFEKDSELKDNTTQFVKEQMRVYGEKTNGWFFWTWKTESAPAWDARFLWEVGVLNGV